MPVLNIFAPDNWIHAILLATAGKTTVVNGVTVPADAVALVGDRIHPLRDDIEPTGWPYIVYSRGNALFDRYAEDVMLQQSEYTIRGVQRQDKVSGDVEDANYLLYVAIFAAFDGVNFQTSSGTVHSCEILAPYQRLYGEAGQKVSEMGVVVRLINS